MNLQCLSERKQAPRKKLLSYLYYCLREVTGKKKTSSKQLFYITFFFQGKQMMKLLNICIFPISIHPKPVNEWQEVAVPVTSLLLENIRTLMAQPYCSFHSRSQKKNVPLESFFDITIFQVSFMMMITACVVFYFCSFLSTCSSVSVCLQFYVVASVSGGFV